MNRFDVCFFDFDGTLGDTAPDIRGAWLSAIKQLDLPLNDFEKVFRVGPSLQETSAMLYPDMSDKDRIVLQETYKHFYDDASSYTAAPYPGVIAMLEKLHDAGVKIFVVTNKRYKPLWKLSRQFDILQLCHGIFSPDIADPVNHLTKRDLLALALRVSGVAPQRALMIGDTEIDILAGKANSCATCAVTWGYASREKLQNVEPDFIVDNPEEIIGL